MSTSGIALHFLRPRHNPYEDTIGRPEVAHGIDDDRELPQNRTTSLGSLAYSSKSNAQSDFSRQSDVQDGTGLPLLADPIRQHGSSNSFFDLLSWWIPELLSALLSTALLLCTVIVLRVYEGRQATALHLPSWLTLNGLIALIATINRAFLTAPVCSAMMQEMWLFFAKEAEKPSTSCGSRLKDMDMFADASMGAWGSLIFLVNARGTKMLACIGCLIMIVSLTYSTFTQQLISLDLSPMSYNATSPGNIPRSETWAQWGGSQFDGLSSFDPGLDMIGAIYNGVLAEGVQPLQAPCPSGNCTWPASPSMAVCGGCSTSSFQQLGCQNSQCSYTFPSGSTATLYDFERYGNASSDRNQTVPGFQVVPGRGAVYNASLQDRLYIMNADLFGAPYWSFADSNPPLANHECALWLCINSYNTSVSSTVQNQTIISTHDKLNASMLSMSVSGLAFYGGTWYNFPSLTNDESVNNMTFKVNLWAYMALQQYLYTTINGTVYWSQTQHFSNDLIRGIWNGTTNPQAWINNVATSMSNVVRSTNTTSRDQYNGTALALTVHIRWQWIILPAILVLMSIVFLVTVMIRTAYSPVKSWKGSPLTFLIFDLDQDIKNAAAGHVEQHHGVDRSVGRTRVRLATELNGIRKFHAA